MFKHLNIATRLAIGFGVVVLLLLFMSVTSVQRLASVNDGTRMIYEDRYPKIVLANEIIKNTLDNGREARNVLLAVSEDEADNSRKALNVNRAEIVEGMAKLRKLLNSEKGGQLWKEAADKRDALDTRYDKLFALARDDKKAALEYLKTELAPTNTAFWKALEELEKFQGGLMADSAQHAYDTYDSTRSLIITLSAIAVALALAIGAWITLSITRPLKQAVAVANRLEAGDLTVKIDSSARDETGQLLQAMRNMIATLTQVVGEVNGGAQALAGASEEVSATAQSLSQASSEQAAGVEETSASIEQMTASISQNTENAKVTDGMAT
ncbi:methyl-accepting chemotaxis protein, partial [Janthinobacterium sp. PC23-8]|uniref:methyl-accepting chemotaxis protein n=1 Tax=Janthinobacterium sp. PC23-8 TaxID=2012679 RepID=UPI0020CF6F68